MNIGVRELKQNLSEYLDRAANGELVVDTSATLATVVQDEFENTYTLPY